MNQQAHQDRMLANTLQRILGELRDLRGEHHLLQQTLNTMNHTLQAQERLIRQLQTHPSERESVSQLAPQPAPELSMRKILQGSNTLDRRIAQKYESLLFYYLNQQENDIIKDLDKKELYCLVMIPGHTYFEPISVQTDKPAGFFSFLLGKLQSALHGEKGLLLAVMPDLQKGKVWSPIQITALAQLYDTNKPPSSGSIQKALKPALFQCDSPAWNLLQKGELLFW